MTNPPDTLPATLADHYRLEHELGTGGMATVYLAHDLDAWDQGVDPRGAS